MRPWLSLTILACALIGSAWAQQFPPKTYDWVRASDETVQLDPADYHTGRVYRPGREGGNMHIIIRAKQPVSLAMTWAESWNTAQQHPETWSSLEYRCMREHVMSTTYECHLPPGQSMVLVIHDERTPDRAIVQGIEAILGKAGARQLISPNDVQITYHSWSCVANCIQPEFDWVRLVKEKYELTSVPKLYSILTPEHDGQRLWVKIKAPAPMTLAVMPSKLADQVYDKPDELGAALAQTSCKQRGVQAMEFACTFKFADGPQSLLIVPSGVLKSHKKAEIEAQAFKCVANCDLMTASDVEP